MKKALSLFLAAFSLFACSKAALQDGKYQGTGKGKGGEIAVEVTVAEGKIAQIDVLSQNETPQFFDAVYPALTDEIVKANSTKVDGISGATLSSAGILQAVNSALNKAGGQKGGAKSAKTAKAASKMDDRYDCDVLVVGTGGAGFAAAIEAKANGANVIMIEKAAHTGGNTLVSGGEMAAPQNWVQQKDPSIQDSVALMEKDMQKAGGKPGLIHVVASGALDAAKWLKDEIGVRFEDFQMFFGGHSVMRSLVPLNSSAVEMIQKLEAYAKSKDIPIYLKTEAKSLVTEDGKVVGVLAQNEGKEILFNAKNVVLATGGFGSNVEMRKKYDPAMDESILSTNIPECTGDGIVMAEKIGADTVDLGEIQTYPTCDAQTGALLYVADVRLEGFGLLLNLEGKRFVEELEARNVISAAVKKQTGACSYLLWDDAMMKRYNVEEKHSSEYKSLVERKQLVKADSIEEACAFFGLNAENVKATVAEWNGYCEAGKDLAFNHRGKLNAFSGEGPYYLLVSKPAIHHCMGGLVIDEEARVLDKNAEPIPALYAAGEVTGGIHGNNRLGSCAIADIMVFGRIAGKNAAK